MKDKLTDQELISEKNKYFLHLLKNKRRYVFMVMLILFTFILGSYFLQGKSFIFGEESYYLLSPSFEENTSLVNLIISNLDQILPNQTIIILPLLLGFSSVFLLFKIAELLNMRKRFIFLFMMLLIISPSFMFTFTTITAYSFFFFLTISGFLILLQKNNSLKYFSLIPFLLITTIDVFSTLFLLILLCSYFYINQKGKDKELQKNKKMLTLTIIIIFLGAVLSMILLKINFIIGPFHAQQAIPDLISDLGGLNGINTFTFLLAIIGLTITWKRKNAYFAYFLLPLVIPTYIYNTQALFHLSIIITFFATAGLIKLFERNWELKALKKFTLFILLLGLLFSTITFMDRINENGLVREEILVWQWIKDNVAQTETSVVFSIPENSYYIKYFAQKKPFYEFHQGNQQKAQLTATILNSTYTSITFPILEENQISTIYINPKMRSKYPADQGLLFLLKNERFKLIHSHENIEVWEYVKKEETS